MARTAIKRQMDMTKGPLLKQIIAFVLPLMLTNFLQTLYNAADMMVVSLSPVDSAVGAISATAPFINLVINIFIGFSIGANVVVAQNIGAQDDDGAQKAVHTSLLMSVLFGVCGGAVGIAVSRPTLILLGAETHLLSLALTYTTIYFIGVPFMSVTNYCSSILRAKGDTKTPLFVLTSTGVLNVLLNLFFVLVCDMSVEGVALATAIANAASAVVLLIALHKSQDVCKFEPKKLRLDKTAFWQILKVGLPAGIQGALFSLSNMLIMSSILKMDKLLTPNGVEANPVMNGNGAAGNLEGFAYTAANSVHQAATTFAGQNAGANNYKRAKKTMYCCYLVTLIMSLFISLIFNLFKEQLFALYGIVQGVEGSLEQIEFQTASARFMFLLTPYVTLACMEVGSGVLRGLGKSLTSTIVTLLGSCVFRVIWILTVFASYGTLESIYISYPISWLLTGAVGFICCLLILRKKLKNNSERET